MLPKYDYLIKSDGHRYRNTISKKYIEDINSDSISEFIEFRLKQDNPEEENIFSLYEFKDSAISLSHSLSNKFRSYHSKTDIKVYYPSKNGVYFKDIDNNSFIDLFFTAVLTKGNVREFIIICKKLTLHKISMWNYIVIATSNLTAASNEEVFGTKISGISYFDFDDNDILEVVITLSGGYSKSPREIIIFNVVKNSFISTNTGSIIFAGDPIIFKNSKNQVRITASSSTPGNDTIDSRGYYILFDSTLNAIDTLAIANRSIQVMKWNEYLYSAGESDSMVICRNFDGNIIDTLKFSADSNCTILGILNNRILIKSSNKNITMLFNSEHKLVMTKPLQSDPSKFYILDVNNDKVDELIQLESGSNKLIIYNQDMDIMASETLDGVIPYNQVYIRQNGDGKANQIVLFSPNDTHMLSIHPTHITLKFWSIILFLVIVLILKLAVETSFTKILLREPVILERKDIT